MRIGVENIANNGSEMWRGSYERKREGCGRKKMGQPARRVIPAAIVSANRCRRSEEKVTNRKVA